MPNHILQHIVIFELVTPMAPLVNYDIRYKLAAPRSKFVAMTKFFDLNVRVKKTNTTS